MLKSKLIESGSYEAASDMMAEEGIEVAPDELKKALELARKKADDELSEDELEEIAGGGIITMMLAPAIFAAIVAVGVEIVSKKNNCY